MPWHKPQQCPESQQSPSDDPNPNVVYQQQIKKAANKPKYAGWTQKKWKCSRTTPAPRCHSTTKWTILQKGEKKKKKKGEEREMSIMDNNGTEKPVRSVRKRPEDLHLFSFRKMLFINLLGTYPNTTNRNVSWNLKKNGIVWGYKLPQASNLLQ